MTSQIYRAFYLNDAGHIIAPPEDSDAVDRATKLIGRSEYNIQLWHCARLVIRLPSLP